MSPLATFFLRVALLLTILVLLLRLISTQPQEDHRYLKDLLGKTYRPFNPARMEFSEGHLLPTFIIIGSQKCGTTSLFYYIMQHPQSMALNKRRKIIGGKEIRFFGTENGKAFHTYMENFPAEHDVRKEPLTPMITGEASPSYVYFPNAASQIHKKLPNVRLIFMARDPAERANSHFFHTLVSLRNETGPPMETFIDAEMKIFEECAQQGSPHKFQEFEKFFICHRNRTKEYAQENLQRMGKKSQKLWALQLLIRGVYAPQIFPYTKLFPPSQLLILQSEDFFKRTNLHMDNVARFLGLHPTDWSQFTSSKFNFAERNSINQTDAETPVHPPLQEHLRSKLNKFFQPFNADFERLTGISWREKDAS